MSRAPATSPSAWSERLPIMSFATVGLCVATALASYQVKLVADVWDPFFGGASSVRVVTTTIMSWLPIPDGVLGMFGYGFELFIEAQGDEERWRTRPCLAVLSGVLFCTLVLVSIGLIVLQAFVVHAWCSLCLASAAISLLVFGWGIREPLAALRYLRSARRRGVPLAAAFWGWLTPQQQRQGLA